MIAQLYMCTLQHLGGTSFGPLNHAKEGIAIAGLGVPNLLWCSAMQEPMPT